MPAAPRLKGEAASPGLFSGPVHHDTNPDAGTGPVQADDWQALVRAVEDAVRALRDLIGRTAPDGAAILEFQVEMLLDPAILEPARQKLEDGAGAALAWAAAMDQYIAGFETADDEQVRARAVDVIDIKNRVLDGLRGSARANFPAASVYLGDDMTPSQFLEHDWRQGGGIALFRGSVSSHVALLARSQSIPMVVALSGKIPGGAKGLLVDGTNGFVEVAPDGRQAALPAEALPAPEAPRDESRAGSRPSVRLFVNINEPAEIRNIDPKLCDGIGLFRTEFLLRRAADLADEDGQYRTYREMLEWAGAKPVTIRLSDIGGDKPFLGLSPDEINPALGLRGIRLLLAKPDLLRIQARALLRAAPHGNLKILLPMVTVPEELDQTLAILSQEAAGLARRRIAHALPPVGIMVEVPATAMMLDRFSKAAFFSIGSNDLAQYLMAAGRDNASVSSLYRSAGPVLLTAARQIADAAKRLDRPLSLCGDSAGDERMLSSFLDAGIREFSVASPRLVPIRRFLAEQQIRLG